MVCTRHTPTASPGLPGPHLVSAPGLCPLHSPHLHLHVTPPLLSQDCCLPQAGVREQPGCSPLPRHTVEPEIPTHTLSPPLAASLVFWKQIFQQDKDIW